MHRLAHDAFLCSLGLYNSISYVLRCGLGYNISTMLDIHDTEYETRLLAERVHSGARCFVINHHSFAYA